LVSRLTTSLSIFLFLWPTLTCHVVNIKMLKPPSVLEAQRRCRRSGESKRSRNCLLPDEQHDWLPLLLLLICYCRLICRLLLGAPGRRRRFLSPVATGAAVVAISRSINSLGGLPAATTAKGKYSVVQPFLFGRQHIFFFSLMRGRHIWQRRQVQATHTRHLVSAFM
jgi:hypothetical protein